jgi:hypothetical protein
MYELASTGALNGRFAAVAGYWNQFALPCPFMPHEAAISGFCSGGAFADSKDAVATYNGSGQTAPVVMPETENADELQAATTNGPAAVVLIVHDKDARYLQCAPQSQSACAQSVVIDLVAWLNGSDTQLTAPADQLTSMGEELITAFQLPTTAMNDVDPRFIGQGGGQVWYARTTLAVLDSNGTAGGTVRVVSVPTSTVVDERALAVSDQYVPGRVVLDASQPSNSTGSSSPQYGVSEDGVEVLNGPLGMQTPPITLYAGPYTMTASLGKTTCTDKVAITASRDVSFSAAFTQNSCKWSPTNSTP